MQDLPQRAYSGAQPWPHRGLSFENFTRIGERGLGDPLNAYPQAMEMFGGRLYVGTSRANLCMLRVSRIQTQLKYWPVECPQDLYELDMRAQIRALDFAQGWRETYRSPMIEGTDGTQIPRDMSYRCMTVFQGISDDRPALYCGTFSSVRGHGAQILRSIDGEEFAPVPRPDSFGNIVTTLRLLVPFKGRLFTSPTGIAGGNPNQSFRSIIYETRDPLSEPWVPVSELGFGDIKNLSVFELVEFGDYLYAGTGNLSGYQVWRTKAQGRPPYRWERIIDQGAWRGSLNQGVASFFVFKDALYVGSGIQHGGVDVANKTGPAGAELIRIHPDGSWDLIVGTARDTPHGRKEPLSGLEPGFGMLTNGYFWRLGAHDGWLYLGTFNWALMLNYASQENWPELFRHVYNRLGPQQFFDNLAGAHLYRSFDGENWLPVTTNGFDNPYNYGIRTLVSTPYGLAVGTVNPFGPRVGVVDDKGVHYQDNPRGGLEIWLGRTERDQPTPVDLGVDGTAAEPSADTGGDLV